MEFDSGQLFSILLLDLIQNHFSCFIVVYASFQLNPIFLLILFSLILN